VRRAWWLALLLLTTSACSTLHDHAYYPDPADPNTRLLAEVLWRAAKAARDDPGEYSFATTWQAVLAEDLAPRPAG